MTSSALDHFIDQAASLTRDHAEPADRVQVLAPLMPALIAAAPDFLKPQHYRSDAQAYTRNLIRDDPAHGLSLYAMVWLPGQWTPVHDHGSWGVVGVVEGMLEERSYLRTSADAGDENIDLVRGGVQLLTPGAVTSFVPNPDHIHVTGVAAERSRTVSLHLYGRTMKDFNIYDVAARSRRRVQATHNES